MYWKRNNVLPASGRTGFPRRFVRLFLPRPPAGRENKNNRGFIESGLIITSILILGLASALTLVKQRQEIRKKASGSSPSCPSGTVDQGTHGEGCGCKKAKEVRKCKKADGSISTTSSDCVHDAPNYTNGCPTPGAQPNCADRKGERLSSCVRVDCDGNHWMKVEEWCNSDGFKYTKTGADTGVSCSQPNPGCGSSQPTSAPASPTPDPNATCASLGGYCNHTECNSQVEINYGHRDNCDFDDYCCKLKPNFTPVPCRSNGSACAVDSDCCNGNCAIIDDFGATSIYTCQNAPASTPTSSQPTPGISESCSSVSGTCRTAYSCNEWENDIGRKDCGSGKTCCVSSSSPLPTITSFPACTCGGKSIGSFRCTADNSSRQQCLEINENICEWKTFPCSAGCEFGSCKPKPTLVPCTCVNHIMQGGCDSTILYKACNITPIPTKVPTAVPTLAASICTSGEKQCSGSRLQTCVCSNGFCSWHSQDCLIGCNFTLKRCIGAGEPTPIPNTPVPHECVVPDDCPSRSGYRLSGCQGWPRKCVYVANPPTSTPAPSPISIPLIVGECLTVNDCPAKAGYQLTGCTGSPRKCNYVLKTPTVTLTPWPTIPPADPACVGKSSGDCCGGASLCLKTTVDKLACHSCPTGQYCTSGQGCKAELAITRINSIPIGTEITNTNPLGGLTTEYDINTRSQFGYTPTEEELDPLLYAGYGALGAGLLGAVALETALPVASFIGYQALTAGPVGAYTALQVYMASLPAGVQTGLTVAGAASELYGTYKGLRAIAENPSSPEAGMLVAAQQTGVLYEVAQQAGELIDNLDESITARLLVDPVINISEQNFYAVDNIAELYKTNSLKQFLYDDSGLIYYPELALSPEQRNVHNVAKAAEIYVNRSPSLGIVENGLNAIKSGDDPTPYVRQFYQAIEKEGVRVVIDQPGLFREGLYATQANPMRVIDSTNTMVIHPDLFKAYRAGGDYAYPDGTLVNAAEELLSHGRHEYLAIAANQYIGERGVSGWGTFVHYGDYVSDSNVYGRSSGQAYMRLRRLTKEGGTLQREFGLNAQLIPEIPTFSITEAKTVGQLKQIINQKGGLQGSTEFFSAERLNQLIDDVMTGRKDIKAITRTDGLRDTVNKLLNQ